MICERTIREALSAPLSMQFFRRLSGHEKPAVRSGGLLAPAGANHVEKDTTNMTAIPLFNKAGSSADIQFDSWLARARSEVFSVTTMMTPRLAQRLLDNNPGNRHVVASTRGTRSVAAYAAMMARGEWALNGSTIVVADNGELNDGQHRCHAVIQAGVAVPMQIVFGVDRASRSTLDQGIGRSPGDILAMAGETNTNILATYLQFRVVVSEGRSWSTLLTPDELLIALQHYPLFHEHYGPVRAFATRMRLSQGYVAGAHGLCAEANPAAAAAFAEAITTGVGIASVNSPVARLRRLFEDARAKKTPVLRMTVAALYVKGFNNFCRGRTGPLAWRDKDIHEAFPVAVQP